MASQERSPFDKPVLGGALAAMADELAGRSHLGSHETRGRGRPPISQAEVRRIRELREAGVGWGSIAQKLGLGKTTVRRAYLKLSEASEGGRSSDSR